MYLAGDKKREQIKPTCCIWLSRNQWPMDFRDGKMSFNTMAAYKECMKNIFGFIVVTRHFVGGVQ